MTQKDYTTTKLSKLKKGEYFRMEGKRKIYQYDGKVRMYSRWGGYKGWGYEYTPVDDIWGGGQQSFADRKVEIGFDY